MTREDAKDMLFDAHAEAGVVDAIYDDFESRTCENCKYYISTGEACHNEDNDITYWAKYDIPKDFGCNKWVSK